MLLIVVPAEILASIVTGIPGMIEQDRWACDRIEIMLWLSRCLIAVLLLSGCYKSVGSEDKESDAGGSGTDTNTGTDGDSDSDIDSDVDTDTDTDSDSDGDADADTDTDTDTDTDGDAGSDMPVCCDDNPKPGTSFCRTLKKTQGHDCMSIARIGRNRFVSEGNETEIPINTPGSKGTFEGECDSGPKTTGAEAWIAVFLFEGDLLTVETRLEYFSMGDTAYIFIVRPPRCDFCTDLETLDCKTIPLSSPPTMEYLAQETGWYGVIFDTEDDTYFKGTIALHLDCNTSTGCACWPRSAEFSDMISESTSNEDVSSNECHARCGFCNNTEEACPMGYQPYSTEWYFWTRCKCCIPAPASPCTDTPDVHCLVGDDCVSGYDVSETYACSSPDRICCHGTSHE